MRSLRFALIAIFVAALSARTIAAPVLMISIDGLRADDLGQADTHGLAIPMLRALAAGGAWAQAVRGVLPTITYPSHTTMITGVAPARHGIASNATFDPEGRNQGGWMWYAEDIEVPTLWDMVKAKGGKVASIGWPVSVGAHSIDYNVPEYWRVKIPEDEKLLRAVSTPGMPEEIARDTDVPFAKVALDPGGIHAGMDDARMAWTAAIIARYRPAFTTLHLVTLDGARHKYGPYSPEAKAILEGIDRGLGPMIARARAAEPDLIVAIVSDHGFAAIDKSLNLVAAFVADGLVTLGPGGKVVAWSAFPWTMGGSAAILLKEGDDRALMARVRRCLARLAADPANGIDRIMERPEIARLGGTPAATFWVNMKTGFTTAANTKAPLLEATDGKGTHGFSPENDAMLSAFLVAGPGIARRPLGIIDMRDIAPTIGRLLDAPLPHPDGHAITVAGR